MFKQWSYAVALMLMGSVMLLRGEEPAPKSIAVQAREMRSKLATPVAYLEKGGDGATKLQDAIDFISDKAGILILVDTEAFKSDLQIDNVHEQPVWLSKMIGLRLGTVLTKLSAKVGGTYLVLPGHILITTLNRTNPVCWMDGPYQGPTFDVEFRKIPLEEALSEMSDLTGINIVLDARAGEKGKNLVTAKLNNAPIATATRLLADMADLEAIPVNGALYVTTKENARRFRAGVTSVPLAQNE